MQICCDIDRPFAYVEACIGGLVAFEEPQLLCDKLHEI